jgi:heme exporter protein C
MVNIRDRKLGFGRTLFLVIGVVAMVLNMYLIFMWVPTEKNLGIVQRIFYLHVPTAWVAFLAFFLVLIGSIGYLIKRDKAWDRLAFASAEVGVLFTTVLIVTGVMWAKPVWGVWWNWDPRLTTSLILWLIYWAYITLRAYSPSPEQGAKYAAILGIIGFLDVPIVYFSIKWWRTLHPQAVIGPGSTGGLDSSMGLLLLISTIVFTILFVCLLSTRMSLRKMEESIEQRNNINN